MPIVQVESLKEEGLEVYSGMTDSQLRDYSGAGHGLFIGESVKVINRALDSGVIPHSLFVEDRWFEQSAELIDRIESANPEAPVFRVNHDQMHELTGYEVTRGPLAALRRPKPLAVEDVLETACRIAIIEDVTNYTNMGAVFRSAAALGIDAVLVTPGCHDPLYRRAARVSMGTVFQVPWARIEGGNDWARLGIPLLHEHGFKTAALALEDDSISLDNPVLQGCEKLALVLGTEGDGLRSSTIASCDYTVKIPMAHDVDSLNVAAASAVAFWELRVR